MLNPDERTQFVEAFEDNLDLLLDLVEAVRGESASAGDQTAAEFMTGVLLIICAFRSSHEAGEPQRVGDTDGLWSGVPTQMRQVDFCDGWRLNSQRSEEIPLDQGDPRPRLKIRLSPPDVTVPHRRCEQDRDRRHLNELTERHSSGRHRSRGRVDQSKANQPGMRYHQCQGG